MDYKHKKQAEAEDKAMNWYLQHKGNIPAARIEGDYSAVDYNLISGSTAYLAEVKVRTNYTSHQIDSFGGMMLEQTKCESIRRYQDVRNIKMPVLYMCFFKDCMKIYQIPTNLAKHNWYKKNLQIDDANPTVKTFKYVTNLTNEYLIETINYK